MFADILKDTMSERREGGERKGVRERRQGKKASWEDTKWGGRRVNYSIALTITLPTGRPEPEHAVLLKVESLVVHNERRVRVNRLRSHAGIAARV